MPGDDAFSTSHKGFALTPVRTLIDRVDAATLLLLAARRRLVRAAASIKRSTGLAARDPAREAQVRRRMHGLAMRMAVPAASAEALASVLIADACRLQGLPIDPDQGGSGASTAMMLPVMSASESPSFAADAYRRWLRLVPPPKRLAAPLRLLPHAPQRRLLEAAMAAALAQPLAAGEFGFLCGRRVGIEVDDLGLRWVVTLRASVLCACAPGDAAEATVRGSATDLLLLASRLEDADTLFFQRRLTLTGDTELGLTARNLLDRLPWEAVPLALRVALHRAARFARAARAAHRSGPARA